MGEPWKWYICTYRGKGVCSKVYPKRLSMKAKRFWYASTYVSRRVFLEGIYIHSEGHPGYRIPEYGQNKWAWCPGTSRVVTLTCSKHTPVCKYIGHRSCYQYGRQYKPCFVSDIDRTRGFLSTVRVICIRLIYICIYIIYFVWKVRKRNGTA